MRVRREAPPRRVRVGAAEAPLDIARVHLEHLRVSIERAALARDSIGFAFTRVTMAQRRLFGLYSRARL